MPPRTLHRWWLITAAYAGLIFVVSVIPVSPSLAPGYLDKVAHLCEYLLFAWLLVQALRVGGLRQRDYFILAWIYAASYGLLIEIVQAVIPWRSAELGDAVANALGAAIGVWIGRYFPRHE